MLKAPLAAILDQFIEQERLPASYKDTAESWFLPLASRLNDAHKLHRKGAKTPLLVGLNGAQGSGKSTLSAFLVHVLNQYYKLNTVCMSLDDFYKTKAQREELAANTHPLLATRGVPGTHDCDLLLKTLQKLKEDKLCPAHSHSQEKPSTTGHKALSIPRFDKAVDDRAPNSQWQRVDLPVDVIILEGWCVGASPQDPAQLAQAVNGLEADHDPEGTWRKYVNAALEAEYKQVFSSFDYLVMLKAPSFEQVFAWRCEQEHKMQTANIAQGKASGGMSTEEISKFIQHYQRITEQCLSTLADKCNEVFELDENRSIQACQRLN